MKKTLVIFSLFGTMAIFGFGFSSQKTVTEKDVEQIHLSCWDEEGQSSVERIRMVLNSNLSGLVWFSSFQGDAQDEGTVNIHEITDAKKETSLAVFALNVASKTQNFVAEIPNFIFQPHVRSARVTIEKNDHRSNLECRKTNLLSRQSAQR